MSSDLTTMRPKGTLWQNACLIAKGISKVYSLHHIERGYENFVPKLKALGADIQLCSLQKKNKNLNR